MMTQPATTDETNAHNFAAAVRALDHVENVELDVSSFDVVTVSVTPEAVDAPGVGVVARPALEQARELADEFDFDESADGYIGGMNLIRFRAVLD